MFMLRLLWDDEIVGYMYIKDGKVYSIRHEKDGKFPRPELRDWGMYSINFNKIELGALIEDTWVFEGDIIMDPFGDSDRTFQVHKTSGGGLYIAYSSKDAGEGTTVYPVYLDVEFYGIKPPIIVVGNIHEEKGVSHESNA